MADALQGLLAGAGRQFLDAAGNRLAGAAKEFLGNAIQEIFVKKETDNKRVLPSINNMKVISSQNSSFQFQNVQDFNALRTQCLQSGSLYEDSDFPAIDASLMFSKRPDRPIKWLRPMEIVDDPQFFVEGYSRFDVQQGELGDCWLLAATANLTQDPKLFFRVVPEDQSFTEEYAGIFHFRFWQYGSWIDVVIDDRLPTYRGELLYMHSAEKNEFWSALLEKAYAKLHGSYEALKGGTTCEAMEDFTGGVTEMYDLKEAPSNLFNILVKGFERNSMMGCSIEADPNVTEAETKQGLIRGHAYSITKCQLLDITTPNTSGKIPLLRLRNPWGNEAEWNGPWSDQSPEWRYIPDHVKADIGLTFDVDGEFWMSFQDFLKYFDRVELCNLSPDSLSDDQFKSGKKRWAMNVFEGEWVAGSTAGGCRNSLETFWHNPQYVMTLTEPDKDDDDGNCTVIVALMQKNRRSRRNVGVDCLTIGFAVYKVSENDLARKPLPMNFFKYNASVARSPAFINLREVSCRFNLAPGHYVIIPSTFDPNEEGEFLIRVFSEGNNSMEENDDHVAIGDDRLYPSLPMPSAPTDQNAAIEKMFMDVAGVDMEVDWMELKALLDHSMKGDLPQDETYAFATHSSGVEAGGAPEADNNILALLCGAFCKDNPLAEMFGMQQPNANQNARQANGFAEPSYEPARPVIQKAPSAGFSKEICRSMVAMLDRDHSGKLGLEEFRVLISEITKWKSVFKNYDQTNSGKVEVFQLREALNSVGYKLNNKIMNALVHRYSSKDGHISFDDFLVCAIKIKTMFDIFKEQSGDSDTATFTADEWIERTVYS